MTTPQDLGRGKGHPEANLTPLTPPSGTEAWATSPLPRCLLSLLIPCPPFGGITCQFCISRDPRLTLEQGREAPSVTTLREMPLLSECILLATQQRSQPLAVSSQSVVLDRDRNLKPHSSLQQSFCEDPGLADHLPSSISNKQKEAPGSHRPIQRRCPIQCGSRHRQPKDIPEAGGHFNTREVYLGES